MNTPDSFPPVRRPQALKPGDTLAIISPAGPSSPEAMNEGVAYLQSVGFQVKVMPHALSQGKYVLGDASGKMLYLAGDDAGRLADLHAAFSDPEVDGILCARGGYGCMRLLPQIDWDVLAQNPKVLIGFSDLTALLNPVWSKVGLIGFHGPMLTSNLIEGDKYSQDELWNQVMGRVTYPYTIPNKVPYTCITPGTAQGPLVGGNLSLLAALCGTPYQPQTQGAILFIEDWHEAYYSLDRQFTQLKLAGMFDGIAGLLLCDFTELSDLRPDCPLETFMAELVGEIAVPTGCGFSVGHGDHSATFPLGGQARFQAETGRLEILSAPVQRQNP